MVGANTQLREPEQRRRKWGLGAHCRWQRPRWHADHRWAVRLWPGGRRAGEAGLEHSTGTLVGERGQACSQKRGQTGLLIRGSQTETKLGTGSGPRAPFHNPLQGKALRSEPSSGPRGHQRGGKSFLFPETPQGWHWELAPSPAWCPLATEGGWVASCAGLPATQPARGTLVWTEFRQGLGSWAG